MKKSINALTYYLDNDSDGYGDSDIAQTSCYTPENHVENDLDCDDTTDTALPEMLKSVMVSTMTVMMSSTNRRVRILPSIIWMMMKMGMEI